MPQLLPPLRLPRYTNLENALASRRRQGFRFGLAILAAGLVLSPWILRNYLVFGRWVPVKSNLAYELYQSQCLQLDGLLQRTTLGSHPNVATSPEHREYRQLGETAYLDRKREQFLAAVRVDPLDFFDRVACRFLGATVWYVPFDRTAETRNRPAVLWLRRLAYPLPFLALGFLVLSAAREPLQRVQWAAIGAYGLYLLPYVGASYYERYAMPLLGVKVLLVVWAADRLLTLLPRPRPLSLPRSGGAIIPSTASKNLPPAW